MAFSLKHIGLAFLASLGAGLFVYSVFHIGMYQPEHTHTGTLQEDTKIFVMGRGSMEASGSLVERRIYTGGSIHEKEVLGRDFGRLASAVFLSRETDPHLIEESIVFDDTKKSIQVGDVNAIFSWYDPFENYTLEDRDQSYRITQITNGSVYVGKEADGTVSLYSIDLVADLTFLAGGQDMTKIIIFPGMYLRFDPKLNIGLRDADLFRIMLALKNTDSDANTGIEFVDPRMSTTGEDVFFMYRLPVTVRPLFELLHLSFLDRVQNINLLDSYGKSKNFQFGIPEGDVIHNPTKNEHYLIRELQMLFSNVVGNELDPATFRTRIESIQSRAQLLGATDRVQKMIEQFLIDGRYALFLDRKNSQIQEVYNEVAQMVGITPTTGKGRLFQSLSSLFSKNLLQATTKQVDQIDNYILAVNELKNTLTNAEMETKDYFDISLYAYLILERMTNGKIIEQKALESEVLYQLYVAIFQATQKYSNGIEDISLKNTAQKSITLRFYDPMIDILTRSLYATYVTKQDDEVHIGEQWVSRDTTRFSQGFYNNLSSVLDTVQNIFQSKVVVLYQSGDTQVRDSLEENIARLAGFLRMIRSGGYRAYQSDPYIAVTSGEYSFPRYNFSTKKLVTRSEQSTQTVDVPKKADMIEGSDQELLNMAQVLSRILGLGTVNRENIQKTTQGYLVNIHYQNIGYTFLYVPNTMSVENILLSAEELPTIRIVDTLPLGNFRTMLSTSADYIDRVRDIYANNNALSREFVNISIGRNEIVIGTSKFPIYD